MFQTGDILRGALFMVAVACWGMCIYNNGGISRRQKERTSSSTLSKNRNKKSKSR